VVFAPSFIKLSLCTLGNLDAHCLCHCENRPLLQTLFHWIFITKDFFQLFKCTVLGLDKEEVDDDEFNQVPKHKNQVEVVSEFLEGWPASILDDGARDAGSEVSTNRSASEFERYLNDLLDTRLFKDIEVDKLTPQFPSL
jgi:hypothetical protein